MLYSGRAPVETVACHTAEIFPIAFALAVAFPLDTGAAQPHHATLEKLPYSGDVLMARALRSGRIPWPAGLARPTAQDLGQTCSPAPCALPNVRASSGHKPVSEAPLAVNPLNSKELIIGGMDYSCRSSLQGFWTSSDGGSTWSGGCAPVIKGATGGEGNPVVGYDLNGNAWRGGLDVLKTVGAKSSSRIRATTARHGQRRSSPSIFRSSVRQTLARDRYRREQPRQEHDLYFQHAVRCGEQFADLCDAFPDGGQSWQSVAVATQAVWPQVDSSAIWRSAPTEPSM